MEKKILNLPYSNDLENEDILNNLVVVRASDYNKTHLNNFINNYLHGLKIPVENTFLIVSPTEETKIYGFISFEENDIRDYLQITDDTRQLHCSELTYFIMDEKILRPDLLKNMLMRILPLIVSEEIEDEVIWLKYGIEYFRIIIDKLYKSQKEFTYFFQRESEYIANVIFNIQQNENQRWDRIINQLNQNIR